MSYETLKQYEKFFEVMIPAAENSEEAFASFSHFANPLLNCVAHVKVAEKVDELIAKLPKEVPVSFWVHDYCCPELKDLLIERKFQLLGTCPLMTWDVKPVKLPDQRIEKADPVAFTDVLGIAFGLDQVAKEGFNRILDKAKIENYLLYLEGKPIGTASFILSEKVGGVFNVAVLPEYQKKGYGRALMHYLMERAHQLGLERLILLSTPQAIGLYEKLGFVKCLDIDLYVR